MCLECQDWERKPEEQYRQYEELHFLPGVMVKPAMQQQ